MNSMAYNYNSEIEGGKETALERLKNKLSHIFLCFEFQAAGKKLSKRNLENSKKDISEVSILLEDLENNLNNCGECTE